MKKLLVVGVILLFLGSSIPVLAFPNHPLSKTIYVDDDNVEGPWDGSIDHPYQHIQDGIDNASVGDTVFVFSGYYFENINITKAISLLGENRTTTTICYVYESDIKSIVTLLADEVIISHFTINSTTMKNWGMILKSVSDCKIEDNIFQAQYGLHLDQSNHNEVCHNSFQTLSFGVRIGWFDGEPASFNEIHDNHFTNTGSDSSASSGVLLEKTAVQNIIDANLFTNCHIYGICSYNSKNNLIQKNIIIGENGTSGIYMDWINEPADEGNIIQQNFIQGGEGGIATSTDGHLIEDNIITNTSYGFSFNFGPRNIIVRNNTVRNCDIGQDIWYADRGVIFEGNLYESNTYGILIDYSHNLTYSKNTIKDNVVGMIGVWSSSCDVNHNNFLNNKIDAFMYLSRFNWMKNYWDRPRILPKPIFGILPFIRFDLFPALIQSSNTKPYDIPTMN
jgi:parallel beta-helix repeat protein